MGCHLDSHRAIPLAILTINDLCRPGTQGEIHEKLTTNMTRSKTNTDRKTAISKVCDAESYVAILKASLTEEQIKVHPPIHLANILALTAELYLLYYDAIGSSFATANELALTLQCKTGAGKDTVEISWLPVAKFKDSASATVEDDSQPDLGDIKKEAKSRPPSAPNAPRLANKPPVVTDDAPEELTDDEIEDFVMRLDLLDEDYLPEKIGQFHELNGMDALERAELFARDCAEVSHAIHAALQESIQQYR